MSTRALVLLIFLSVFLLAGGICLAVWPSVEKQNALDMQKELVASIAQGDGTLAVPNIDDGEVDFYEETGEGADAPIAPVPAASTPEPGEEETEIVIGTGILTIDSIDLKLPVVEGVRSRDLKVALGHVPDTPPIGDKGNAVIAGHRSYTYGHFLNRLGEVEIGERIHYADKQGYELVFQVYEILIVEPGDPAVFDDTAFPSITLLTCTPVRVASHRLIVRGKLVEP